jgi:hypothetical protein
MPAPADHDHVGLKTFRFSEDSFYRRFVQDFDFDVRPAARKRPPCTLGRPLGATIQRCQQNRPPVLRPGSSRTDRPDARPGRPRKVHRGRDGRLGAAGSVCRHQNTKLSLCRHAVYSLRSHRGVNRIVPSSGCRSRQGPSVVRDEHGAEGATEYCVSGRCPATRRTNDDQVGLLFLRNPDNLRARRSSGDENLCFTPTARLGRNCLEQMVASCCRSL